MEAREGRLPTLFIIPFMQLLVGSMLFIALLYGQRDLSIWGFLVLGVAAGAKVWSRMGLSGVRCDSNVNKRKVFPGEKLTLEIEAENNKFLPVWLQMSVPVAGSLSPSSDEETFTKESGLLWYQRARFEWVLTARRRGVHQIGPPRLMVGDLLGFFPREKETDNAVHIIVYPRIVPLKSFSLPRRDFFGVPGAKSPVQDPVYILGTRDYQHWQPARFIHWKASAHHNRLQEKVFEPSEQEKVLLVVDADRFARHGAEEKFEEALEIVASMAVRLDRKGYAVGLVTNGDVVGGGPAMIPIGRNPQQLPAILEVLARLQMTSKGDLVDMLRGKFALPWGVSCVHFSYEEDETTLATEEYFRRGKVPVMFFMCRPRLMTGKDEHKVRGKIHSLDDISMKDTERT